MIDDDYADISSMYHSSIFTTVYSREVTFEYFSENLSPWWGRGHAFDDFAPPSTMARDHLWTDISGA